MPELNLLTLNCYGVPYAGRTRVRLLSLGRELDRSPFDIICLQEVQLWAYLPLLLRSFPHWKYHAYEPFLHAPKGGLLTLSRRPITRQTFRLYSRRGRLIPPSVLDWLLHKGVLVAETTIGEAPVVVVNTHLVANYSANWSDDNLYVRHQKQELQELSEAISEIDRHALTIIAGDFNMPTRAPIYLDFVRDNGLVDPLADSTEPTFRPPPFFPSRYVQPLDHVLVRPPPTRGVEASARIALSNPVLLSDGHRGHLSDHSAIALTVRLAPPDSLLSKS